MKPGEMTLDQLLDALEIVSQEIERSSNRANEANGAYVEHAAIRAELLARLNVGGGSPDFKTVNSAIEALTDSAQLLREKEGSAGFDASVVLIIERAIQALKSVETEGSGKSSNDLSSRLRAACVGHPAAKIPWPHRLLHEAADWIEGASQPLQPRCPECKSIDVTVHYHAKKTPHLECRNCDLQFYGSEIEFFSAPPAMSVLEECFNCHKPVRQLPGKPAAMPAPSNICVRCNQNAGTCNCHQCGAPLCDHVCEEWHLEKDCKGYQASLSSPQLKQVAREIAENNCEHFADGCRADYVNRFTAQNLAILLRHFPGGEGAAPKCKDPGCKCAAHRIPENENQAEVTCSFEFKGEVCGKILRASSYRHAFLQSGPINMFNHVFQGAASPPVAAAVGCSKCGCKKGDTCGHKSCKFGEFCDFTGTRAAPLAPRKETE